MEQDKADARVQPPRPARPPGAAAPRRAVAAFLAGLAAAQPAAGDVFPADAGILDVRDFGAIPDDGVDDTAALQRAIDRGAIGALGGANREIIFLPDGVYDVSDTLVQPFAGPGAAGIRTVIQGQSRDGAVLRLRDNLRRPDGSAFDGAIFTSQSGSADFFQNSIRSLTFDVGRGNPLASGVEFNASNQGAILDVRAVSQDGAGNVGVDLGFGDNIGPLLARGIEVEGFDVGVRTQFQGSSPVIEDVTVRNQNRVGFQNSNTGTAHVRNLRSENAVPAVSNSVPLNNPAGDPGNGRLTLIDAELINTGTDASLPAIQAARNGSAGNDLYARNVSIQGYGQGVEVAGTTQGVRAVSNTFIDEYWQNGAAGGRRGGTFELFGGTPDTSLGLGFVESPASPDIPLSDFANPQDFGAVPDDGVDDTAAIQAAIDSGARAVYLPNGRYTVNGTVTVRGNVEQILGTEADINRDQDNTAGRIVIADGAADTVFIERLTGSLLGNTNEIPIEHASDRTLVVRNFSGLNYRPTVESPGDLFLDDVVGGDAIITEGEESAGVVFRNQNVYARQYNNEVFADAGDPSAPDTKVLNDGANVVILGFKTERRGTNITTINGGSTEVLGFFINGTPETDASDPAFVTVDSSFSIANLSIAPDSGGYEVFAREVRGGEVREAADFNGATVYSAVTDAALFETRQQVYIDNGDIGFDNDVILTGDWRTTSPFAGGYLGEDFLFTTDEDASIRYQPDLPVGGLYEVEIRELGEFFNQDSSGSQNPRSRSTALRIVSADGEELLRIDQGGDGIPDFTSGGQFFSLGEFRFDPGQEGFLEVFYDDLTSGVVVADSVRFTLVPEPGVGLALATLALPTALGRRRRPATR